MAESNDTNEYLTGSRSAFLVLGKLTDLASEEQQEQLEMTTNKFFDYYRRAADLAVRSSGAQSEYVKGFISALAEYVYSSITVGEPDLDGWRPICAMTEDEFAKELARYESYE